MRSAGDPHESCLGIWVAFFLERASNNRADRNYLKPRLTLLMQLQGVWGEISNLYGSGESIFTDQVIPTPLHV